MSDRAVPILSTDQAATLLLQAQGLLADPSKRATPATTAKLIESLGFVQIDSINIVERAHHLTLFSRLDGYRPSMLARLLERDRLLFEHWTHDASAIPVQWFAHWKPRFTKHHARVRRSAWWRERMGRNAKRIIAAVRERIEREGPLLSRDFENPVKREGDGAWWGWKPDKAALEYLWRSGELAIAQRVNFHKVYDLMERVLPEAHASPEPDRAAHIDWACRSALERLGVATPTELAVFWRAIEINEARDWCERAVKRGDIERVQVQPRDGAKAQVTFAAADWKQRLDRASSPPARMRLLSPFDPVLRDRQRAMRLFGFDYRFEAFVPAAKRKYGYYTLPMLEGDRFVGRADAKFHRDRSTLALRVFWEAGIKSTRARRAMLDDAASRLALQIGAERSELSGGS